MSGTLELWIVIVGLGLGSFGMRFAFLGLVGDRPLPAWLLRHLRYTAVAILPALVAPLVVFPDPAETTLDPSRLIAAVLCFAVAYTTKNVALAVLGGAATYYGWPYLF